MLINIYEPKGAFQLQIHCKKHYPHHKVWITESNNFFRLAKKKGEVFIILTGITL